MFCLYKVTCLKKPAFTNKPQDSDNSLGRITSLFPEYFGLRNPHKIEMAPITMSILLLAGFAAVALCAPTLKDSPSNKVIVDDEQYLSQDERERIVAGIILQIARDFDEGYITQDELEGRSAVRPDDVDVTRKGKDVSEVPPKASNDKTPP